MCAVRNVMGRAHLHRRTMGLQGTGGRASELLRGPRGRRPLKPRVGRFFPRSDLNRDRLINPFLYARIPQRNLMLTKKQRIAVILTLAGVVVYVGVMVLLFYF